MDKIKEAEDFQKKIKEILKANNVSNGIPLIEQAFEKLSIFPYFNRYNSPGYYGVDIAFSNRSYSFACKEKSFLGWRWWSVKIVYEN
ncbi:MAG: hypothetical protein JWM20_128 [Patescibacteria group bacterium]|nr:hypothetical protein [Patescibacteria group bacterium]